MKGKGTGGASPASGSSLQGVAVPKSPKASTSKLRTLFPFLFLLYVVLTVLSVVKFHKNSASADVDVAHPSKEIDQEARARKQERFRQWHKEKAEKQAKRKALEEQKKEEKRKMSLATNEKQINLSVKDYANSSSTKKKDARTKPKQKQQSNFDRDGTSTKNKHKENSMKEKSVKVDDYQSTSIKENPTAKNSVVTKAEVKKKDGAPKFAYAWLLGGIPSPDKEFIPAIRTTNPPSPTAYRGLIYNILVSVKILRDAGSKAEFVLLVHMAEPDVELSEDDVELLEAMDIIIKYCPPYVSTVNEIAAIPLEKFRILELTDYDRVTYLDADVTPRCNLDYIMEQSYNGILEKNVLISIGRTPASAKFFVLTPGPGEFLRFVKLIPLRSTSKGTRAGFQPTFGWGYNPFHWNALSGHEGGTFVFTGADNDQGLLFQWAKYSCQSVSIIIGKDIQNWSIPDLSKMSNETISDLGKKFESWVVQQPIMERKYLVNHPTKVNNTLNPLSCSSEDVHLNMTGAFYVPRHISPKGVAPYRDFVQWSFARTPYPWHLQMAALDDTVQVDAPYRQWFHVMRQLDEQMKIGLGLHDKSKILEPTDANWNYIPEPSRVPFHPMWSQGVKELRQWANRIVDTSDIFLQWDHPLVTEREDLSSFNPLRTQCKCPNPYVTDICTSSIESIEDWLSRRVPTYLSLQRPLCPDAARHDMHIILPFDDASSLPDLQSSVCSAVCQDYTMEKATIYVLDNGSPKSVINQVCKDRKAFVFDTIPPLQQEGKIVNEAEMMQFARESFTKYMAKHNKPERGPSLVCARFAQQLPKAAITFWSFQMVRGQASANDIMVLLENGEFSRTNALSDINDKYISNGAFMTYGSYADNYGPDQSSPFGEKLSEEKFLPRKIQWVFGGPYSFKAFMVDEVGIGDFTHEDASWLVDSANRGFFYRMLERAELERLGYMEHPIATRKQWHSMPAEGEQHKPHITSVLDQEDSKPLVLPVRIVMICTKSRKADLLKDQLEWIQKQEYAKRKIFHLHLLTDGSKEYDWVNATIQKFEKTRKRGKEFNEFKPIQVFVEAVEPPLISFSRFNFVRELRKRIPLEAVIFLASDSFIESNAIAPIFKNHEQKSMTSWYGMNFTYANYSNDEGVIKFSSSESGLSQLVNVNNTVSTLFAYSGHDYAILDTNLWLFSDHLFRIQDDPELKLFLQADDVWVSYVMDALLGWPMRQLVTRKPPVVSLFRCVDPDQVYARLVCSYLPAEVIQKYKWEGLSFRVRGSIKKKRTLFEALQKKQHWHVGRRPIRRRQIPAIERSDTLGMGMVAGKEIGNTAKPKRAFMCVTGQIERVELENKIKNLFAPIQEAGFELDVALVLSKGKALFTNVDTKHNKTMPFYQSFNDAVKALEFAKFNVITHKAYPRLEMPEIPQAYVELLYTSKYGPNYVQRLQHEGDEDEGFDEQVDRARNHIRIFDSYQRCLSHASSVAVQAQSTVEDYYDVFLRIREDIAFAEELDKSVLEVAFPPPPKSIVVTECRNWQGMNDRMAIVAPDVARAYFTRPLEMVKTGKMYDTESVRNPESLLLYAYTLVDFYVLGHPKLKGLLRSYKLKSGEVKTQLEDRRKPKCPAPDPYRDRFYTLFGWVL